MKKGSISLRCALLDIARSTYYEHSKRVEARYARDAEMVARLRTLAEAKKFKLGIKTLTMAYTRTHREPINHKKVARLKREYDIPTKIRTRRYQKPQQPRPTPSMVIRQNVVDRQFNVMTPYRCAGTDVTYLWIPRLSRFAYLANVRDMATGEYLGWEVSFVNDQALADGAVLDMERRHVACTNLVLHSDRGGAYTSAHFQNEVLTPRHITASMSRKGNCIDNAPTESGHGHLKDCFDFSACTTLESVTVEVDRVIHYFNEERPQWHRKKMTPVEYRDHLLLST
jgi:transposase InsO family protein